MSPALCPLGHCQLDPLPGQDQPLSAAIRETIFARGVFKDLCFRISCFSFLLCSSKDLSKDEEKGKGNKYVFLVTRKHFFK